MYLYRQLAAVDSSQFEVLDSDFLNMELRSFSQIGKCVVNVFTLSIDVEFRKKRV
jgi:hypothetical protein